MAMAIQPDLELTSRSKCRVDAARRMLRAGRGRIGGSFGAGRGDRAAAIGLGGDGGFPPFSGLAGGVVDRVAVDQHQGMAEFRRFLPDRPLIANETGEPAAAADQADPPSPLSPAALIPMPLPRGSFEHRAKSGQPPASLPSLAAIGARKTAKIYQANERVGVRVSGATRISRAKTQLSRWRAGARAVETTKIGGGSGTGSVLSGNVETAKLHCAGGDVNRRR